MFTVLLLYETWKKLGSDTFSLKRFRVIMVLASNIAKKYSNFERIACPHDWTFDFVFQFAKISLYNLFLSVRFSQFSSMNIHFFLGEMEVSVSLNSFNIKMFFYFLSTIGCSTNPGRKRRRRCRRNWYWRKGHWTSNVSGERQQK